VSVPRIWEALYQGIVNKIKSESKLRFGLFKFFVWIGSHFIRSKKTLMGLTAYFKKPFFLFEFFKRTWALIVLILTAFWYVLGDILVFGKIRARTGGCLHGPVSGGGALPEYLDIFYSVVKIEILEGWGLTETAPVIGVRLFERLVPRTVGPAAPEVEIKICDEKGKPLTNQHEKGIVFVKGPNVMPGYYRDFDRTRAVLSKDGWLNTGDLGRFTITGELQLTGRAKDTIVLIGGENIEPQPIEDKIVEEPLIHQIMVVGQDKKVLGALIIPAEENLYEYAKKHEIKYKTLEDLCVNNKIKDAYREIIKSKINLKNGFRDYERISFFTLIPKPFEVGKEMTHSLKIKRNVVAEKYAKVIEDMYKKEAP
jgi:long-chain acyl-CoA synthetase